MARHVRTADDHSWGTLMPKPPSRPEVTGAARRAVRVTVAATAGFYPAQHLLDQPVVAVYALFSAIAFGALSPLPGSGRTRAATVLRAVPAAVALIVLGTVLAVATWAAVVGMLAVGFVLTFGAACAPRLAAVVPGLQLCYILACFPPYAPGTVPERLAGLAVGVGALALCEALLLPAPWQPSYADRLAGALDLAARTARHLTGAPGADRETAARLRAEGRALRFSRQPAGSRPTGAGRRDRALAQAGSATRRLLDQLAALTELPPGPADIAAQSLLRGTAAACADTAALLRGRHPAAGPEVIVEMTDRFLVERTRLPHCPEGTLHALLRRRSTVLSVAVSAVTVRTAASLATGGRRSVPGLPHEQFWYAALPARRLWLVRIAGNLTRNSVVFQNAVRTMLGLALARLVAGSFELTHGFWVLLAVLTLGRTTAGATWSAVRSAALGTLLGAVVAGVLVIGAGNATAVYAVLLVPTMLLAFSVGPVGGPAWAQGLFTLVVSMAFAQLAPVTWRLAEARLVDVLTGSAIGLLCGLLAWPSGARAEIRRGVAALLRTAGPLVRATADAVTGAGGRRGEVAAGMLWLTLHRLQIAEAAYAQYRAEPVPHTGDDGDSDDGPDWLAALNYGSRVLIGAYWLPQERGGGARSFPPAVREWAHETAGRIAAAGERAADHPGRGLRVTPPPLPWSEARAAPATALPRLVDMEVWLHALARDLETAVAGAGGSGGAGRGFPDLPDGGSQA
ncbi:FUSC family protein [Streptomyces sp. NPDC004610]|uniref:FUSC family protein n=1 Tax=unclassified Streptomyces TaxID=2593676 RepID=UPI0033B3FDE5